MGLNKLVDFSTAKILKEKGFDKRTPSVWLSPVFSSLNETSLREIDLSLELFDNEYNAPTIAEVVMWLFEKHGIWMWVEIGKNPDNFYPVIHNTASFKYSPDHWRDSIKEAYEAGIIYTLKKLQ